MCSLEHEEELVKYVKNVEVKLCGLTIRNIWRLAYLEIISFTISSMT